MIQEIVIGPKSKVLEKDIRQFLLSNNYEDYTSVKVSRASYQ